MSGRQKVSIPYLDTSRELQTFTADLEGEGLSLSHGYLLLGSGTEAYKNNGRQVETEQIRRQCFKNPHSSAVCCILHCISPLYTHSSLQSDPIPAGEYDKPLHKNVKMPYAKSAQHLLL